MNTDFASAQLFDQVRDPNESVLWAGRPAFLPFLATGIPFLVIGVFWFCIDFFGFIRPMLSGRTHAFSGMAGFMIPFFALHLFPFWGSLLNVLRLALVHQNTAYAITNRRVMFRGGFWGISFDSIDFDQITDLQVSVGPLENCIGAGTITISCAGPTSSRASIGKNFVAVPDPYEVFKEIKKVSLDVKTDIEYPNNLRPPTNSGYKTAYTAQ
jgi:Bacterial PH domain